MKYITGIHGLNIENSKETCGDWHCSALYWDDNNIDFRESNDSIFGDWGIELNKHIPEHDGTYAVADDLRSILDLMVSGSTRYLIGFRDDFICTDKYNEEFMEKVWMLKGTEHWKDIDARMRSEFMQLWVDFHKKKENSK